MMSKQYVQTGTFTATASEETAIELGFSPTFVEVINVTQLVVFKHFDGMDADTSINIANADATQISINAADGLTLDSNGFSVGTDVLTAADDVIYWVATR